MPSQSGSCVEPAALGVREEGEAGAEPRPERRLDLGRVDADDDDPRVGDLELVLEPAELAHVPLLLRTPPTAGGEQRDRVPARELREGARSPGVIGEVEIGEAAARREVGHGTRKAVARHRWAVTGGGNCNARPTGRDYRPNPRFRRKQSDRDQHRHPRAHPAGLRHLPKKKNPRDRRIRAARRLQLRHSRHPGWLDRLALPAP